MASDTSHRPAWQRKVLSIPDEQRSWRQRIFAQCIDLFDDTAAILCDYGSRNALDIKNPAILRALCSYYYATLRDGNFSAGLMYYQPAKKHRKTEIYLNTVILKILDQKYNAKNPDPAVLVPMWLAATIGLGLNPYSSILETLPLSRRSRESTCMKLSKLCITPSIKKRCDSYLANTLELKVPTEKIKGTLDIALAGYAADILCRTVTMTDGEVLPAIGNFKNMLNTAKKKSGSSLTRNSSVTRAHLPVYFKP